MKGIIRKWILGCLVTILLFALAGCGAKVSTTLSVDSYFSGERVIQCRTTESDMNSKITGGEAAVDNIINNHRPNSLAFSKTKNGTDVIYTFKLMFNGYDDYKAKVDSLLGRTAEIEYSQPVSVFSEGLTLREDFNSRDLLGWFYNQIVANNLMSDPNDLWEDAGTKVYLNGNEIRTGEYIDVQEEFVDPISRLQIDTRVEEEQAERTVSFTIPAVLYSRKAAAVDAYLNSIIPENGSGRWETNSVGGKVFTITYSAPSVAELKAGSDKIFTQTSLEVSKDTSNPFVDRTSYYETISLANFGGQESEIYVVNTYSFPADDNRSIELAETGKVKTSEDGQYIEYVMDTYATGEFDLSFGLADRANVEGIDIAASVDKTIKSSFTVDFKFGEDKETADRIAEYYKGLGEGVFVERTARDGEICRVYINEYDFRLPEELYRVFGCDGQASISSKKGFFSNEYSMYLYYDYSNLISMASVDADKVNFVIDLNDYRVKDFQSDYQFAEVERDLFAFEQTGYANASVIASKLNFWNIFIVILDGIAVIVLLIAVYIVLLKRLAAKDHREDVSFRELIEAYGKPAAAIMAAKAVAICGVIKEYVCKAALFIWKMDEIYYPPNANRILVQYFYGSRIPYKLVSIAAFIVFPVYIILNWILTRFHAYEQVQNLFGIFVFLECALVLAALVLYCWNRKHPANAQKAQEEYDRLEKEYTMRFRNENGLKFLNMEEEEVSIAAPLNLLGPDLNMAEEIASPGIGANIFTHIIMYGIRFIIALKRIVHYEPYLVMVKGSDGKVRYSCISQNSWYMSEQQLLQYNICYDFCTGDIYKEYSREVFYQDAAEINCTEDLRFLQFGDQVEKHRTEVFCVKSASGILMKGAAGIGEESHGAIIEAANTIMTLTRSKKAVCHEKKCSRRKK